MRYEDMPWQERSRLQSLLSESERAAVEQRIELRTARLPQPPHHDNRHILPGVGMAAAMALGISATGVLWTWPLVALNVAAPAVVIWMAHDSAMKRRDAHDRAIRRIEAEEWQHAQDMVHHRTNTKVN